MRAVGIGSRCASLLDNLLNEIGCNGGFDVFPHSYRQPSSVLQPLVGIRIACLIRGDLGRPVRRIHLRSGVVTRTAVPETAIDKDGHLLGREHNVGRSVKFWQGPPIDVVT